MFWLGAAGITNRAPATAYGRTQRHALPTRPADILEALADDGDEPHRLRAAISQLAAQMFRVGGASA